jgi:DNA-binding NtrC family response regulator
LGEQLVLLGYERLRFATTVEEALEVDREDRNKDEPIGAVFVDWNLPWEEDGPRLVREIRALELSPQPYIILMSVQIFHAREAIRHGAEIFLEKHCEGGVYPAPDLLAASLQAARGKNRRHFEMRQTVAVKRVSLAVGHEFLAVGRDPIMKIVSRVAGTDNTILITGETGTGKELIARAIHHSDPSRSGLFVTWNAGGMSETLIDKSSSAM